MTLLVNSKNPSYQRDFYHILPTDARKAMHAHLRPTDIETSGLEYGDEKIIELWTKCYDAVTCIPGIRIVKTFDAKIKNFTSCIDFAFHREPFNKWFKTVEEDPDINDSNSMHLLSCHNLSFLKKKGLEIVTNPQVGDVIVYFDEKYTACHYGIVSKIIDEQVVIHSKFGHYHLFEHPQECVPEDYGNQFAYCRSIELL